MLTVAVAPDTHMLPALLDIVFACPVTNTVPFAVVIVLIPLIETRELAVVIVFIPLA